MATQVTRVVCPACEEYIFLRKSVNIDDKVRCPHCYTDLVVVQLDPIELDWDEYDEEEVWDLEDDLDEEDEDDD